MQIKQIYDNSVLFLVASLYVTIKGITMTKAKNIEYKNGMKFTCGPPMRAGGYEKWNWCKLCDSIYDKSINRCGDCGQMVRAKPKSNKTYMNRLDRERARTKVLQNLSGETKALYTR
jgi:hypothetical protein|tara:strand:- start:1403 stop:1753 length:351 start_codon:yes stop_codon:yes gene_type:complete